MKALSYPYLCESSVTARIDRELFTNNQKDYHQRSCTMENEVPTSYKVANEASTAFKNFRGIDSWANFVTAKETPLME